MANRNEFGVMLTKQITNYELRITNYEDAFVIRNS